MNENNEKKGKTSFGYILVLLALCSAIITVLVLGFYKKTPESVERVLVDNGYSNITNIERGNILFNGCLKNEPYVYKFKASNSQGREVEGLVCSSLFGNRISI